jgi:hypothetical protein
MAENTSSAIPKNTIKIIKSENATDSASGCGGISSVPNNPLTPREKKFSDQPEIFTS